MSETKAKTEKTATQTKSQSQTESEEKEIKEMLVNGVQFGHKASNWHPNMEPYIYGTRDDIHMIDLFKTKDMLEKAADYLVDAYQDNKNILFVGTLPTYKEDLKEFAEEFGFYYVINRWIGGTFTNFSTISETLEKYRNLERKVKSKEEMEKYTKKEQVELERDLERMERKWGGVKELEELPDVIFVINTKDNRLAVKEANKMGIPVIALTDTNVNPEGIDYPIPANDDSHSSVTYILNYLKERLQNA